MANPIYRAVGFSTTQTEENVHALTKKFHSSASRRLKTGTFIGLDQLVKIVKELKDGKFDGLQICYGLGEPTPGSGERFGRYELILTEVALAGEGDGVHSTRQGLIYTSVEDTSTEPTNLGCPPLACPPGGGNN